MDEEPEETYNEDEWEDFYWNYYQEPPDNVEPPEDWEEYNSELEISSSASGWFEIPSVQGEIMRYPEETVHRVLHLSLGENDAGAATVGEYLGLLLSTLWLEVEGFSGKRPFGNSDWQYPVYIAMSKAGLCEIVLDEDGYVEEFSREAEAAADELILQAIRLAYDHGTVD